MSNRKIRTTVELSGIEAEAWVEDINGRPHLFVKYSKEDGKVYGKWWKFLLKNDVGFFKILFGNELLGTCVSTGNESEVRDLGKLNSINNDEYRTSDNTFKLRYESRRSISTPEQIVRNWVVYKVSEEECNYATPFFWEDDDYDGGTELYIHDVGDGRKAITTSASRPFILPGL
ncbi:MAG: hypothetical protein COU98_02275 [Candidatus Staskawiczbacteria bacterium CG10_big_fil_rev_8_21_14_0_10_38_10]|uniref:Uncharacterized protein n=1 Tax=Candidatus Staskawiczbacteria bacterium CG10_big_fil_rev_8_21_14_0_10_38_10 TaxID=1974891 RepID=A0A2H9T0Y9_9BACT|nr:MAG: hypothetical protein COU98_02275 [Candidatus Staskawiczbacteria bacterium CG10_big_fil_rev_8_21_14_0_10_38_10]